MGGREGTALVRKEALSPPKEALRPLKEALAHRPPTDPVQAEVAASAAVLVGVAGSAQVAGAGSPASAAEDRVGHGVAADCGEPWKQEARKMAESLADTFLHASELQQELSIKKAEIQRAEAELIAAADAVIEARGETARARAIGEAPRRCTARNAAKGRNLFSRSKSATEGTIPRAGSAPGDFRPQ